MSYFNVPTSNKVINKKKNCIVQMTTSVIFFCVNGKFCWESVDELYGYHLETD